MGRARRSRTTTQQSPHWLQFNPKTAFSPSTITTPIYMNTPIPQPSQTASGSNQPFCHSTLSRPTDRQTHTQCNQCGLCNAAVSKLLWAGLVIRFLKHLYHLTSCSKKSSSSSCDDREFDRSLRSVIDTVALRIAFDACNLSHPIEMD